MIPLAGKALSALFPQRCVFCRQVTTPDQPCCPRCAVHLRRVGQAAWFTLAGVVVYSPFYYRDEGVQRLADLKFHNGRGLAAYFATQMTSLLQEQIDCPQFDLVTFVPMPPERERGRGYNQALLLAEGVAHNMGLPVDDCDLQKPETFAQHDLHLSMRLKQVSAGLTIRPGVTLSGSVLLVDDLCTSGATLAACIRLLRGAGASQITAITAFRQG